MISFCHGGDGGEILSWWREREREREGVVGVIENCRIK
jgi:hypothetical protein